MTDDFQLNDLLEQELADVDVSSFNNSVSFLKKEVSLFLKVVAPLSKTVTDFYGKNVFIQNDNGIFKFKYYNAPFYAEHTVDAKVNGKIPSFFVELETLQKFNTVSFSTLVFVNDNDEIKFVLGENMLFLTNQKLDEDQYADLHHFDKTFKFDVNSAKFILPQLVSVVNMSDRVSEKSIAFVDDKCVAVTGYFQSEQKNPFAEGRFVMSSQPLNALCSLLSSTSLDLDASLGDNSIVLSSNEKLIVKLPITTDVESVYSSFHSDMMAYKSDFTISNESMLKLLQLSNSLAYLSDIIQISFNTESMILTVASQDNKRTSDFIFPIVSGESEFKDSFKQNAKVLLVLLNLSGIDVQYATNNSGFLFITKFGVLLLKRTVSI